MTKKQYFSESDMKLLHRLLVNSDEYGVHPQHKLELERMATKVLKGRYIDRRSMSILKKYK